MPTVSIHLPDDIDAFATATRGRSGYIRHLLEQRMSEYAAARFTLADYSRPEVLTVLDAMNGLLITEGMAVADQITINIEDTEGLAEKWEIAPERWARLLAMTEREAEAFRVVGEEFWQGRPLD